MTWASSIEKPWSSEAVRQGASPTAQSTSATTPHDRHTTWWWLSPTRPSNRAGLPAGSMRLISPAAVSACSAAVKKGLEGVSLEGVVHAHSRYKIAITATYAAGTASGL